VVKEIGEYATPGAIGLPNDSISSLKVGNNVQVILCNASYFRAGKTGCEIFTDDNANLRGTTVGNDKISSVQVQLIVDAQTPYAELDKSTFDVDRTSFINQGGTNTEGYSYHIQGLLGQICQVDVAYSFFFEGQEILRGTKQISPLVKGKPLP